MSFDTNKASLETEKQIDFTDILVGIRKIIRVVNIENKHIEKEYGVSIPQLLCMNFLASHTDFTSNSGAIKNYLNLNASTVTGIVDRLEKKAYIAKLPKSGDKRVLRITLTQKGSELVKKFPPLMHERLAEKLKELPQSKLGTIQSSLNFLTKVMGADNIDASPVITIQDPI